MRSIVLFQILSLSPMNEICSKIKLSAREKEYIALVNNHAYKINVYFYNIISCIQDGNNFHEALLQLKRIYSLSNEELETTSKLFMGFVETLITNSKKEKVGSYIKYKITLFDEKCTQNISSLFLMLFGKRTFTSLFIMATMVNILFFSMALPLKDQLNFSFGELWILFIISNIFIIFHEIGHSCANLKFNLPVKKIGFGIYFIIPVFFSNVTGIWLLPKKKRVIVNVAGIYFQLLLSSIFIAIFFIFNDLAIRKILLYFISSNTLVALYSFIPFFRNDGYWIYSDVFNIPNLMFRSDQLFINDNNKKCNIPLLIFCISNWMFRLFIFYKLTNYLYINIPMLFDTRFSYSLVCNYLGIIISITGIYLMFSFIYKSVTYKNNITGGF